MTTIDPLERVRLVCSSIPEPTTFQLNGTIIGTTPKVGDSFAADITHLLKARNELVVDTPIDGIFGDVAIEISQADSPPA